MKKYETIDTKYETIDTTGTSLENVREETALVQKQGDDYSVEIF